jgi:hypothetical protein
MSSKRQRKHKELGSLKTKQHAPQIDALDLLGEVDELGDDGCAVHSPPPAGACCMCTLCRCNCFKAAASFATHAD